MVDIAGTDGYVLDVFRARGGENHRLIYPGPAQEATVEGLALTKQEKGTFAGPDVEYTKLSGPGETIGNTGGFSYLCDVERSAPTDGGYTVDFRCEDLRHRIAPGREPHLRIHALTPCDEVALASGQPPQNKSGNPVSLRYLVQSRLGAGLQSQFANVLEPYDRTPLIRRVRRLSPRHTADPDSVAAVAVDLADGQTDILIACEQPTEVHLEGGIEMDGTIGFVRLQDGTPKVVRLIAGTRLAVGEVSVTCDRAAYTGTVKSVDVGDPAQSRVTLDPPLPAGRGLEERAIHFVGTQPQDTTYWVRGIDGDAVSTGTTSLILGFEDEKDFTAGYTYLVNPGDSYSLPCVTELDL